jgi:energy-coupling factor transporter transmembrane protein EcfT
MIPAAAFGRRTARREVLPGVHAGMRVAGGLLAMATAFAAPAWGAGTWLALGLVLLAVSGLEPATQLRTAGRWWPVAVLVLAVHTLTTTTAAPLGRPSWAGLAAGAAALVRVAASAAWLGLLVRTTSLDDLVAGLRWWLGPLGRGRSDDLGLVLGVALGTAPALLGEARRIEAVASLRQTGPAGTARRRGPMARARDRAAVALPLVEVVARRAEALSLSLRRRRPEGGPAGRPGVVEALVLAAWAAGLVALAAARTTGGRW